MDMKQDIEFRNLVVYKKVRSRRWTSIDIGLKPKLDNPAVESFLNIVRRQFLEKKARSAPRLTVGFRNSEA